MSFRSIEFAAKPNRLTTLMAIDILGFSRIAERDETQAIRIIEYVRMRLEAILLQYSGRLVNTAGDGFLAEFQSAKSGLIAATKIASEIRDRQNTKTLNEPIKVRIGLHVGDVADQPNGDLLGHGVNVVVRLQQNAYPNHVLASNNIMNLVGEKYEGTVRKRTSLKLKNMSGHITAFDLDPKLNVFARTKALKRRIASHGVEVFVAGIISLVIGSAWTFLQPSERKTVDIEALVQSLQTQKARLDFDPAYIRYVLRTLQTPESSSNLGALALIKEGDIDSALQMLESRLDSLQPGDPAYAETLHQIGLLAYQYDDPKAVAVYEALLLLVPSNRQAATMLGYLYDGMGRSYDAQALYRLALENDALGIDQFLALMMDLAFNQLYLVNPQGALDILTPLAKEVRSSASSSILSRYLSDIALAHQRLDHLELAEDVLVEAITLQKRYGFDHDLSRSYAVMGQVLERRGDFSIKGDVEFYNKAREYYELWKTITKKLKKPTKLSESLLYLGDISLKLNELEDAEKHYMHSRRIAREVSYKVIDFRAQIGLSLKEKLSGNAEKSCKIIEQALLFYHRELDRPLNLT